jgi:Na+:H+ antiporter, NhaA family
VGRCCSRRRSWRWCGQTRHGPALTRRYGIPGWVPRSLHLDLTVGQWAADGLLAIFFFVAGLELKREFVAGNLRDPRQAALPVAAAVGGMVVPALLFVLINHDTGGGALRGGAIPIATDIAFALAVWR